MARVLGLISLGFGLAAAICWGMEKGKYTRRAVLLTLVFSFIAGFTLCLGMGSLDFWLNTAMGVGWAIFIAFAIWWTSLLERTGGCPFKPLRDALRQRRQQSK